MTLFQMTKNWVIKFLAMIFVLSSLPTLIIVLARSTVFFSPVLQSCTWTFLYQV